MLLSGESLLTDRRVTEWVMMERAREHTDDARSPSLRPGLRRVITISRQYGAGGHTVAEKIAALLGPDWQIWDRQIVEEIARNAQARTWMVEALDERARSWIDEIIAGIASPHPLEALAYRRHLTRTLLTLAHQGNKIIVGRGANFVLPEATNVRLRASVEFRIRAIMEREALPREAATRRVHETDHARASFTRSVFDRDIEDPAAYDMFLQVDTLGVDAAAEAVVAAARSRFEA